MKFSGVPSYIAHSSIKYSDSDNAAIDMMTRHRIVIKNDRSLICKDFIKTYRAKVAVSDPNTVVTMKSFLKCGIDYAAASWRALASFNTTIDIYII